MSEIDYSILPYYRQILTDEDLLEYSKYDEVAEYRWITAVNRIDWHKFFAKHTVVHSLALSAAKSIPNNPVGFLRPDWVNRAIQKYSLTCPPWAKEYALAFEKSARERNIKAMKEWFEVIENIV